MCLQHLKLHVTHIIFVLDSVTLENKKGIESLENVIVTAFSSSNSGFQRY